MSNSLLVENGKRVSLDVIKAIPCPPPTKTWTPVAHHDFIEIAKEIAEYSGLILGDEEYSSAQKNKQCFGTIEVTNFNNNDVKFVLGLRNSINKTLSAGICFGTRVLVCDNLAFTAFSDELHPETNFVVRRKHTRFVNRDLPEIIKEAMTKAIYAKEIQENLFDKMRNRHITKEKVHDLLIKSVEFNALPARDIMKVRSLYLEQATEPETEEKAKNWYPEFQERTYYSLHNMFTEHYKKGFDRNFFTTVDRSIQLTNLFRRELEVYN